jgi:aromatic ring-opening dioxygenase catalytic subunit (LigB family)
MTPWRKLEWALGWIAKEVDIPGSIAVLYAESQGWDHGIFIPMLLINPAANIPIIQLSVLSYSSPAENFAMGRALASLRESGVAIIGSGMPSFHNLRLLFSGNTKHTGFKRRNSQWNETLTNTMKLENAEERGKSLEGWREWVGAEEAHPAQAVEHFLPLVVCAGAGGEGKAGAFVDEFLGSKHYSYFWK